MRQSRLTALHVCTVAAMTGRSTLVQRVGYTYAKRHSPSLTFIHTGQRPPLHHLRRTPTMIGLSLVKSRFESTKADDITMKNGEPQRET
jgi:hypothetical protein